MPSSASMSQASRLRAGGWWGCTSWRLWYVTDVTSACRVAAVTAAAWCWSCGAMLLPHVVFRRPDRWKQRVSRKVAHVNVQYNVLLFLIGGCAVSRISIGRCMLCTSCWKLYALIASVASEHQRWDDDGLNRQARVSRLKEFILLYTRTGVSSLAITQSDASQHASEDCQARR
jgi:hypothetical protein